MTLPGWLFAPQTWIGFWVTLGALALWAVFTGSREWDRFEDEIDKISGVYDQDSPT